MADDINDACEALAAAARYVEGLKAKAYVDDAINPPEAQVFHRAYDPRLTLGGSPKRPVALGLRIFVRRMDLRTAQLQIRSYMAQTGPTSVIEVLETSTNWPPDTDYVEVTQIGQPFETTAADASYFAVDFDVDVILGTT